MTVLGISTNTRLLGMAVISGNELIKRTIRLHKSPWSPTKADLILSTLEPCVRLYSIKKVVLSIPPEHHQTEQFRFLRACLQKHFADNGIPLVEVPSIALYAFCQGVDRKTKKDVMAALVSHFPRLKLCYEREMRNKTRYYVKLFEAVGVAALSL